MFFPETCLVWYGVTEAFNRAGGTKRLDTATGLTRELRSKILGRHIQPIPADMKLRISIGMPNFEMPNLDSVNFCTTVKP